MEDHLRALGTGALYLFSTWKRHAGVPHVAAGVYTIWRRTETSPTPSAAGQSPLVYVGLAGGHLTAQQIQAKRQAGERRKALWLRLQAHASGQRSGDQLAVYVADLFILPTLSAEDIAAAAMPDLDELRRLLER